MLLTEHVYCVAIVFKMTEQVGQWICVRFCIKLAHSSMDDSEVFRGRRNECSTNERVAQILQRRLRICCKWSTFCNKQNTRECSTWPLQPRSGALQLLAFPQTKITIDRQEILGHWWDSGKYDGGTDGVWENCVRSQGTYFEGERGIIILCTIFLISCILLINVFILHITWLDTLHIHIYII